VYLDGFDSHTAWVNSRALALAGITRHTADPPGGKIVRDEHGEPTGALQEAARLLVEGLLPRPTRAVRLVALRRGLALARQLGLTRVITCGDPAEDASDHAHLDLYEELQRAHQLTLRLYAAANVSPQRPLAGQLTALEALRRRYPPKGDWIATGAAKIFLDGVVEAHTAAMLAPYTDDPTTTGRLNWAPGPYKEAVRALDERRFQIFTHAIGDAAVRLALDAYGDAQTRNGRRDARHRIEHIETVAAADIPRFADLGVYASFQPLHARPDEDTLKVWLSRAGADRAQRAWAWQSIRRRGGQLAFGSDWPVVTLDPWQGLQSAVTRQMTNGQPAGGWIPSERLDVGAAIAGYTLGAAASIHRDGDEGSLRPGKLADLIIVSQDLFAIDPLHIGDTRVLLTMVGGEVVYTAPGPR
jgi:predicted amidohydrolase YtcJ